MKSTLTNDDKEYRWKGDGTDGLRSYSFAGSNPTWNYSTEPDSSNVYDDEDYDDYGAYKFSDSSTGQPFARRGNLYNWTAATLGSSLGLTTQGQQAPDSICPHGWQLPVITANINTSVPTTNMTNKSFARLLRTYGVAWINGDSDVAGTNLTKEWPLQYLPTGHYYSSYGYIGNRTGGGYWWSGVIYSATSSYGMNSNTDNIGAQDYTSRGNGYALRCVRTPSAKVYTTMSSIIDDYSNNARKEYYWKEDGSDGLRSYNYAVSNPDWSYSTEPDESNKDEYDSYAFSDSSTGQPFARRGNLYNWTAATLGSGLSITSGQAADSICPRGWQLPVDGNNKPTDKSWDRLIQIIYEIVNNDTTGAANRIKEWPFQYLPTGEYYNGQAGGGRTGYGYWWTNTTSGRDESVELFSYPGDIGIESTSRGEGYALRCEVRNQNAG